MTDDTKPNDKPVPGPVNEPSLLIQVPKKNWKAHLRGVGEKIRPMLEKIGPLLAKAKPFLEKARPALARVRPITARGWAWTRARALDPAARGIAKLLPRDLVKSFPTSFEPAAVAEWSSRLLQRAGGGFWLTLVTVVVCSFFLSDLTALLLERAIPEPPPSSALRSFRDSSPRRARSMDEYAAIFGRNLFNSQGIIPGDEGPSSSGPSEDLGGEPVKTTLPLNLIGTLILRDELRSIATIEDKAASMVYPVRADDEIPSKIRILRVEPRRVVFINTSSGRREFVELPDDGSGAARITVSSTAVKKGGGGVSQTAPNQYTISRSEVDKAFSDLNNVLTQARCVPNFENGLPAGFKCFQIVPGSIYEKIGMQNGDVLCGLNGQGINDISKAMELLGELKTANHLELCIKRDGKQTTYAYDIN